MLHYTTNGVGKTIVLIHGFCENSTCFNEQVFLLKARYNVITIDLPGHGKSPVMTSFSMTDVADEVKKILDVEAVSSCILIGHSMGGYVTLAFAKKYPALLNGFGLLHSTANADNDDRKKKREQAIRLINLNGPEIYLHNFIPPLFAEGFSPAVIAERQTSNETITAEALTACLTAMKNREDNNALLAETNLPVAFIIGKNDALIPAEDMLRQSATAKTTMVTILNEAAHMGMLEEPEKVAEAIQTFAAFCIA
ncbi:MAG: alpha/beta hydrolase [Bacteroidota bacterium]